MDITLKQARELRKVLLEKSPELLEHWKHILNKDVEEEYEDSANEDSDTMK